MVQSGYGYILCQIYMVADGCGADNGVAQSDSGIFPDNQVAYSIVQTRKSSTTEYFPREKRLNGEDPGVRYGKSQSLFHVLGRGKRIYVSTSWDVFLPDA